MSLLSLHDFCSALSISPATGKNWLKQGTLIPTCWEADEPFFSDDYLATYQKQLENGARQALRSRRNKTYISGTDLYKTYIDQSSCNAKSISQLCEQLATIKQEPSQNFCHEQIMYMLLTDCAIQLLSYAILGRKNVCSIHTLFQEELPLSLQECIHTLLAPLLSLVPKPDKILSSYPSLFKTSYRYLPKEDTLGFLYMSLKSMTERKATGAYYTPAPIVKKLISSLSMKKDMLPKATFLDPCCGTGNFLIQLPNSIPMTQLYGFDIDAISIYLTRINMALRTKGKQLDQITSHFVQKDFLLSKEDSHLPGQYDVILGNPPWGFAFDAASAAQLKPLYQCAKSKRIESYDLFVERSLSLLTGQGILSFVLPEAILQVKNHHRIRSYILQHSRLCSIQFLGNIFYKVLCPCIILQLSPSDSGFHCKGAVISMKDQRYKLNRDRNATADGFYFTCDDVQYKLFLKVTQLPNIQTLKGHADFALGIVTGNNDSFLSDQALPGYEPIIRGMELTKYQMQEPASYIRFQPDILQQAADESLYRVPEKLCYRFISEQLVFAYDDAKRLTLNSCNILIPRIPNLSMKYILAILNSRVHQFIFHTYFHSVKVLRSHLEELPIPVVSAELQYPIIQQVDQLLCCKDANRKLALYNQLDLKIAELFHLSQKDYELICNSIKKCTLFL